MNELSNFYTLGNGPYNRPDLKPEEEDERAERLEAIRIEKRWNTSNDRTFLRLIFLLYLKKITQPIKKSKIYLGLKRELEELLETIFISNSERW